MNTSRVTPEAPLAKRPVVVWVLMIFLALRIALDLHSLIPGHLLVIGGPESSRAYNLYVALLSLTLFRVLTLTFVLLLIWRRHWTGLIIAAIFFSAELYTEALRDMTGGVIGSMFGPPASQGDAIARTMGRYSVLIAPIALLAWCSIRSTSRRYFHYAL